MSGLVSHRDVKTARGQYRTGKEREKKREEHGGVDCDELSSGGGGGVGKSPFLEENEQSHSLLMRGVRGFLCCVLEEGLPFYIDNEALGANFRLLYKGQVGSDWAIGGEFLALNLLCLYCAEGTIILIQK